MVAKGISQDDFPENGVGRWSYNYTSEEPMYCLEGSPTHSPRRVVPYFFLLTFGSVFSKTTSFVLKSDIFLIHGLGKCEGVGEDSGHGLVI